MDSIFNLSFEWIQYDFMRNALTAIILVSPLFALLGCMVINNQMTFFSEALGHAALTGIAIGAVAGLADPTWPMIIFATFLTGIITLLRKYSAASTDTIVGLVMAFSVALGIVILSKYGGINKYSKFLVGDILTITTGETIRLAITLGVVLLLWILYFNKLFLVSLNRSLAQSRGINVWLVEFIFSLTVALVVTVSIQWIGLLVINSMLILPAAAARNIARNISSYTLIAVGISLVSGISGLISSYYCGTATGATIVLISMGFFILSLIWRIRKGR
ncbi:MAG TPA: ABC transporter [Lentisphaeria bacterium]|nr:MAG: ABC transporter [Lentisphaerae bacterium GWF2_50_93]HCE43755.1 ABC transporter [Lentisphaeria bacterium]